MRIRVSRLLVVGRAGQPPRCDVAILNPATPVGNVAMLFHDDGQEVQVVLSGEEARNLALMLAACGCVADGGLPPVVHAGADPTADPTAEPSKGGH